MTRARSASCSPRGSSTHTGRRETRSSAARAVVRSWIEDDPDDPGTYDGAYEVYAVEGDRAVAVGTSTYARPDGSVRAVYDNCFLLRFDAEGRCSEFTEWFMERPTP